MSHTHATRTLGGVRIGLVHSSAATAGAGTLFFLHGAGGVGPYAPFLDLLAPGGELWAPEHPGFGDSDTPAWLTRVEDLAYYYLDVLAELDLAGVHLVGQGLGGWIAAALAIKDCARLASLTLIAAAGVHVRGVACYDDFMASPDAALRALVHDGALAQRLLAVHGAGEARERQLKNRFTTARLAWQPRYHDPHLPRWLHRVRLPTHLVWGEHDRLTPPRLGEEYRRLIPGARLTLLPGCGHLPPIEQPQACAAAVRERLDAVPAEEGRP